MFGFVKLQDKEKIQEILKMRIVRMGWVSKVFKSKKVVCNVMWSWVPLLSEEKKQKIE
jgi:hypothetical protein